MWWIPSEREMTAGLTEVRAMRAMPTEQELAVVLTMLAGMKVERETATAAPALNGRRRACRASRRARRARMTS